MLIDLLLHRVNSMTNLQLVDTEKIIEELHKRFPVFVFAGKQAVSENTKGRNLVIQCGKDIFGSLGYIDYLLNMYVDFEKYHFKKFFENVK